jgi:hypothetical protein
MVLFFQFDIDAAFELPFRPGSHLLVFMCPEHNEIDCDLVYTGQEPRELPPNYWLHTRGHSLLVLNPPGIEEVTHEPDAYLQPQELIFAKKQETITAWDTMEVGASEFKVGGVPAWSQDPEGFVCACGAPMEFLCQVPDGFGFDKLADAPKQPDSFSAKQYCLFLGNDVYIFACAAQCHPRAVWIALQN